MSVQIPASHAAPNDIVKSDSASSMKAPSQQRPAQLFILLMQMYVNALAVCLVDLPKELLDSAEELDSDLSVVVGMTELLQEAMMLARNLAELNPATSREWHMEQPSAKFPACLAPNAVVSWHQAKAATLP